MSKTIENKKVVSAVRNAFTETVRGAKMLQKKGESLVKSGTKKWNEFEKKNPKMKSKINSIAGKIEKNSKVLAGKTIQLKKDITKGVKLGMADLKKKGKK